MNAEKPLSDDPFSVAHEYGCGLAAANEIVRLRARNGKLVDLLREYVPEAFGGCPCELCAGLRAAIEEDADGSA
jgi:hypothetical protein